MVGIMIKYRGKYSWETELRQKTFSDLKTKTQYCRRNNIKEYELYNNGKRVVMLNDRMVDIEILQAKLKEIQKNIDPKSDLEKLKEKGHKW